MDAAIVRGAQAGDHDSFAVIVDASIDRLYAISTLIARDPGVAEESVQDALVRAWRDLPKLREPEKIASWLAQLTVHATYDVLRRQRRVREMRPLLEDSAVSADHTGLTVDRLLLGWAYGRLPAEQRAVVVLHYYAGLTLDEVAATLGIAPGTARSRLHGALQAMRRSIGSDATAQTAAVSSGAMR
jgi:RNA polymerase sigma-70 factor (ECF subfamily)